MEIKQGISKEIRKKCVDWAYLSFDAYFTHAYFSWILETYVNWDISLILSENDVIYGLYLLGDRQLSSTEGYKQLNGVEGVLLAVSPLVRKQGWGTKFKDYTKTLGYDYIWGYQAKELNNLQDWLKRRELVHITEDCYTTAEKFLK